MSSMVKRLIATFIADGTIRQGCPVKIGTDAKHVAESVANTDLSIGIAQCAATIGQAVEVAMPGGGAKMLANETITAGKLLVPDTNGGAQTNASGDRVIAQALESAVSADLFSVMVVKCVATAADQ